MARRLGCAFFLWGGVIFFALVSNRTSRTFAAVNLTAAFRGPIIPPSDGLEFAREGRFATNTLASRWSAIHPSMSRNNRCRAGRSILCTACSRLTIGSETIVLPLNKEFRVGGLPAFQRLNRRFPVQRLLQRVEEMGKRLFARVHSIAGCQPVLRAVAQCARVQSSHRKGPVFEVPAPLCSGQRRLRLQIPPMCSLAPWRPPCVRPSSAGRSAPLG